MRVLIVGAGFAGLEVARGLRGTPAQVTVVDRYNHHVFQPLLYQVATSVLSPGNISAPIRRIVRGPNCSVLLAQAQSVDAARKVLVCDYGELPYDQLVLACGATHSYFGHPEWAERAPGLKTIDDATDIRRRILLAFEAAERETDANRRREWMTFVIIGGGPTGVELAGALADLAFHTLKGEFRNIDTREAHILLVEGLPRILSAYPEELSARAQRDLEKRGVMVRTNAKVTNVDALGIQIGETSIPARTTLWGAGVAASPLGRTIGVSVDRAGRVPVTPELTVPGHDDIFVIGDMASVMQDGKPVPGVAPAAMQMGRHAAENIRRRMTGKPLRPFHYNDRGSFSVVGRGSAVGVVGKRQRHVAGWPGYLAWGLIHVFFLIGFRNRVTVMSEWIYYLFTGRRNVRIITGALNPGLPKLSDGRPPSAPERQRSAPREPVPANT